MKNTLTTKFPRASKDFIALNSDYGSGPDPESQRIVRDGSLAKAKKENRDTGKFLICITSYRVRLLDPDNLIGKWHLDSLRYAKIIPDDRPEDIVYQIGQKKVATKKEEKTLIRIDYP